eukprot:scaffold1050_cov176-Ochromonas_danica.AAC.5
MLGCWIVILTGSYSLGIVFGQSTIGVDYSCLHANAWLKNRDGHYDTIFHAYSDILLSKCFNCTTTTNSSSSRTYLRFEEGSSSSSSPSSNSSVYWQVDYEGIPRYDHNITLEDVAKLNGRPSARSDFRLKHSTVKAGDVIGFGQDVGYAGSSCLHGYWPPGSGCVTSYHDWSIFPLSPAAETNQGGCTVQDWALQLDTCGGNAPQDTYQHYGYSPCLAESLNDTGLSHSPVYGFANDGFPIYGPYQSAGQLAVSCWQIRNYSAGSPLGCADNSRSCLLVDKFHPELGTQPSTSLGPGFTDKIARGSYSITAVNGAFYQDYYFNANCSMKGREYLNEFNGHDHDNLGFHYHLTVDNESFLPSFPYSVGPKYYGCIQDGICVKGILGRYGWSISTCATSLAKPISSQSCLAKYFVLQTNDQEGDNSANPLWKNAVVDVVLVAKAKAIASVAKVYVTASPAPCLEVGEVESVNFFNDGSDNDVDSKT